MDRATDLELPEAAAYRFRGIALDPSRGVLLRPDGAEVELRPKAAAVLRQLVRSPGRVVSRDGLMEAVWPGVVVTDDSITQCVAEIRRALGDEGAQLLRTLSRRGYMLVAEVAAGDAWPAAAAAPRGGAPSFRTAPLALRCVAFPAWRTRPRDTGFGTAPRSSPRPRC
jgi:DNA-binding winged helix-turn-helix (wHTH) protein